MIFFQKKKFVLDCFVQDIVAYEKYPISHAREHRPTWLNKTESTFKFITKDLVSTEQSTIKRCHGLIDNYNNGIIIPMWSDLNFESDHNGYRYSFADGVSSIESHSSEQWKTFADPTIFNHIKIISPWLIKANDDIKYSFLYPFWNHKLHADYFYPNATIGYKYQHATNINMFIHANSNFRLIAGDPIVQITPMTEKEIVIKNHLVSKEEYSKIVNRTGANSFNLNYVKNVSFMKSKEKKCPFNFGK